MFGGLRGICILRRHIYQQILRDKGPQLYASPGIDGMQHAVILIGEYCGVSEIGGRGRPTVDHNTGLPVHGVAHGEAILIDDAVGVAIREVFATGEIDDGVMLSGGGCRREADRDIRKGRIGRDH